MQPANILFVDDESAIRACFTKIAARLNSCRVQTAGDGRDALKKLRTFPADIVITDMEMPQMDGITLLKKLKKAYPEIFVILLTGRGSFDNAVEAMKLGAYDYLQKPLSMETVRTILAKTVGHKRLLNHRKHVDNERRQKPRFNNIIGQDPQMYVIYEKIVTVAQAPAPVLITGESGSGKELVADEIHYRSPRANQPLKKINCAAFTETLFTSELFGHEKGAFTGACQLKKGVFEAACSGTLFLDEIGEMSLNIQAALLRAIETGAFHRVGGSRPIETDARVVCATNTNLIKSIEEKRFRPDLYYRVNVVFINMPPLRRRKSDIPLLTDHFVKQCCRKFKRKRVCAVSSEAMQSLMDYDWPGNVRELANAVHNAVLFCTDHCITPANLPPAITANDRENAFELTLRSKSLPAAERSLIQRVLQDNDWNLKRSADDLEIARSTLYSKMKKYGISP